MRIKEYKEIRIFWGDLKSAINPDTIRGKLSSELITERPFNEIQKNIHCHAFAFLNQVHKAEGKIIIGNCSDFPMLTHDGDYLITQEKNVGIGILTADCLPIIVYDPVQKIISSIHAGWKGLTRGIIKQVLLQLQQDFFVKLSDLVVMIGPSADDCCYEVKQDFVDEVHLHYPHTKAFLYTSGTIKFSLVKYLKEIIIENGLSENQLDVSNFECTICSDHYCSVRKTNKDPNRQLTVVSLK